jgi:stearoyl-CoA desaturase (delta-9 desaturase)
MFSTKPWMQVVYCYCAPIVIFLGVYFVLSGATNPLWLFATVAGVLVIATTQSVGYHRLFGHRSFKCNRCWHYIFSVLGTITFQGSPIAWVYVHKAHHRYSDTNKDPHRTDWLSWFGWRYRKIKENINGIKHLTNDAMQIFVHKYGSLILLASVTFLFFLGWEVLLYAYAMPTAFSVLFLLFFQNCGHKNNTPINNPMYEFFAPLAGEWEHKTHHENPSSPKFGKFDWGWKVIKLIKTD